VLNFVSVGTPGAELARGEKIPYSITHSLTHSLTQLNIFDAPGTEAFASGTSWT